MNRRIASTPRTQAALLLHHVLRDHVTLDDAMAEHPLTGEAADTRFVMMLVLTVLRHLGQLDALLAKYVTKPLPDKRTIAKQGLRLGAAQLLLMHTPAHAATNETVKMVKASPDNGLIGLINAVMQRIGADKPALPAAINNLPEWLRARWEKQYGKEVTETIANVAAERPPLDLSAPGEQQFEEGARLDNFTWRLPSQHAPVTSLPGYQEGSFWVQDVAATYPVRMLGDVKGMAALELCAAPGGKTAQLAKSGAAVTALDRSGPRLAVLKENMARLQLPVTAITADLTHWEAPQRYDIVLLDAPCTATGTWRRHPEVLAITQLHDVTDLARTQRMMLNRAWGWVKPGGRLLYCVCSLEVEEGEHQAAWFLQHHSDSKLEKPGADIPSQCVTPEGTLRTRPDMLAEHGGMDGFFAAAFRKV